MSADLDAADQLIRDVVDETRFSGVVRIDVGGEHGEWAFGLADRRHDVAMTVDSRLSIASATKGFTALTAMAMVESAQLSLDTTARSMLGDDLELIDEAVTVEHLLGHRSGIGDYLDESELDDINAHVMPAPVHELWATEQYLPALEGHPQVFRPGERFAYNNSGYVVLAIIAERAAGKRFEELVSIHVCRPAGLLHTGFELSDQLPADVASGYLEEDGLRTNVFHLPVIGSGDGGMFSTVGDVRRFWLRLFDGSIVPTGTAELMTTPRSDAPHQQLRYGMGFWLHQTGPQVILEGYDAGISFRSTHDPEMQTTTTVISNTSSGAWPMVRALDELSEVSR